MSQKHDIIICNPSNDKKPNNKNKDYQQNNQQAYL